MRQPRVALLPCLAVWALHGLVMARTMDAPGPLRSEADLRSFYHQACTACHGEDGSATSPDGHRLKGRDFTATRDMERFSDKALVRTIRRGLFFGLSMPAYHHELSEEEALLMVRNIVRKARKGTPIQPPNAAMPQTR